MFCNPLLTELKILPHLFKFSSISVLGFLWGTVGAAQGISIPSGDIFLRDDSASVIAEGTIDIDVLRNDSGAPGTATVRIVTPPNCGMAEISDGKIRFSASQSCESPVTIEYGIDLSVSEETAKVTIEVAQPLPEPDPEPEVVREARDDEATTRADAGVSIPVLLNDELAGIPDPDIVIKESPKCGTAEVLGNAVLYRPTGDCVGPQVFRYSLDTGESAEVQIDVRPAPPRCPTMDGAELVYVPAMQIDLGDQIKIGFQHSKLISQYSRVTQVSGKVDVEEFCISLDQIGTTTAPKNSSGDGFQSCRQFDLQDLATGYSWQDAKDTVARLDEIEGFELGLPSFIEIMATSIYLDGQIKGDPDLRRQIKTFETSLRTGAREWLADTCSPTSAMLVGGNCKREANAICLSQDQTQNDLGMRIVARKQ